MSKTVIKVENLYKEYRLGVINHGTLTHDLQSWWARVRGKEDPNSLISVHHSANAEKDSFLALRDINFEVKPGDRVGIIGRNGAGKSTLLKILSRITSPTRGNIKIKGRVGSLLEVGTGFHPELTGRENIYLNGAILGMSRKEITGKLDEIVDFAGIEKHIDTPVKRYSSGMNVRLGFAVAAHLEPEILVVDEVLAVGDAEFQKKAIGKMEDVSTAEGRTILFVSHNMAAVRNLCNYGMILNEGSLIYQGESSDAVNRYYEIFTSSIDEITNLSYVSYPENESLPAQILSARIYGANGNDSIEYDVFEQIFLEIEYVFREDMINVDIGFTIERNSEIFAVSFDVDRKPELLRKRVSGRYKVIIELPSPLKAGVYGISSISIGQKGVGTFNNNKDVFTFSIIESSFDTSIRSCAKEIPGQIATDIDWQMSEFKPLN